MSDDHELEELRKRREAELQAQTGAQADAALESISFPESEARGDWRVR